MSDERPSKRPRVETEDEGKKENESPSMDINPVVTAVPVSTDDWTCGTGKMPDVPMLEPYGGGEYYNNNQDYDDYYNIDEDLLVSKNELCITVTGSAGVGKSVFYACFCDRFTISRGKDWIVVAGAYQANGEVSKLAVFDSDQEPERYEMATQTILDRVTEQVANKSKQSNKKVLFVCDGPPKVVRGPKNGSQL